MLEGVVAEARRRGIAQLCVEASITARPFFEAAAQVQAERPGLHLVVPTLPGLREAVGKAAHRAGLTTILIPKRNERNIEARTVAYIDRPMCADTCP